MTLLQETPTEVFYMVEGRLLASGVIPLYPVMARQIAYFCTTCGEIWGRILIEGGKDWEVIQSPCRHHTPMGVSDWGTIPGSLVQRKFHSSLVSIMDAARCLDLVPDAVVKYEFLLSLNQKDPQ